MFHRVYPIAGCASSRHTRHSQTGERIARRLARASAQLPFSYAFFFLPPAPTGAPGTFDVAPLTSGRLMAMGP